VPQSVSSVANNVTFLTRKHGCFSREQTSLLDNFHGISSAFDQWFGGERVLDQARWQAILEQKLDDLVEQNAAPTLRAGAARKLLNVVPTCEHAVRALMTAFVDLDEGAEAIREYERFRLMADTNGLPLSEKTVALYEAIRLGSRMKVLRPLDGTEKTAASAGAPAPADFEPSIAVLPFRRKTLIRSARSRALRLLHQILSRRSRCCLF